MRANVSFSTSCTLYAPWSPTIRISKELLLLNKDLQRNMAFAYLLIDILHFCRSFFFWSSDEEGNFSASFHNSISFFTPWYKNKAVILISWDPSISCKKKTIQLATWLDSRHTMVNSRDFAAGLSYRQQSIWMSRYYTITFPQLFAKTESSHYRVTDAR